MAIAVDHEKRRAEIMHKALELVGEQGYPDVTYQQIADKCELSRTTLYKYFKNKREIFDLALMQMVLAIGRDFEEVVRSHPSMTSREKIRMLWAHVVDTMALNPPLIRAIIEYLIGLIRRKEEVQKRVRRHTVGMHRLLLRILQEGIAAGEFRHVEPDEAGELLYALLEAATLRMTLLENYDRRQFIGMVDLVLDGIRANGNEEHK